MPIRCSRGPAPSQFDRMPCHAHLEATAGWSRGRPTLPGGIDKIYRSRDGPLYEHELLRWLELRLTTALSARCIGE